MDFKERKHFTIDKIFEQFVNSGEVVFHDNHGGTLMSELKNLLDAFKYRYDISVSGYDTFSVWRVWELVPYKQFVPCFDCGLITGCTHPDEEHYQMVYPEPTYKNTGRNS